MNLTRPLEGVTPTLDGPVLQALGRTTYPLTRQQITDLAGDASEAGVRKVLRRLVDQGVVTEQRIGGQYSYSANRDHLLWPGIETILDARNTLKVRLVELVTGWRVPPLSMEIFGSVAQATAAAASDIDVLLYRPTLGAENSDDWDEQLVGLKDAVRRWTGNECEILDVDAVTLVEMVANDAVVLHPSRDHVLGVDLAAAMPDRGLARTLWLSLAEPIPNRGGWASRLDTLGAQTRVSQRIRVSPPFRVTFEQLTAALAGPPETA